MIAPTNDLDPTGADLIADTGPDSLEAVITTIAYLRASWPNRTATDVNAELDRLIARLQSIETHGV